MAWTGEARQLVMLRAPPNMMMMMVWSEQTKVQAHNTRAQGALGKSMMTRAWPMCVWGGGWGGACEALTKTK
jgi:hypothetical protein